jgi:acyl-[acyl-carrier-protein] desaturase
MSLSDYDIESKQVATDEKSAAARLDRATEERMYALFKTFFRIAEEERRWTVWSDVPWELSPANPSPDLVETVLKSYREDLFLPDYSARALHLLRASRGRAWFITRWSYEEGKHMLGLNEWLMRTGAFTDVAIRELTEAHLQSYRWEPVHEDGIAVMADMLLWELGEIARYTELGERATAAGDQGLAVLTERIVSDETAHREFLRSALAISVSAYPEAVADAIARVAVTQEYPGGAGALTARFALPTA